MSQDVYARLVRCLVDADPADASPRSLARYLGGLELGLELAGTPEGVAIRETLAEQRGSETYLDEGVADIRAAIAPALGFRQGRPS